MPVTLNNLGIVFSDTTSMTTDEIPSNTRTVFANTSAPSGWTRLTGIDTFNDSMLRLSYATGGSSAGSGALSFGANTVPSHTHTYTTSAPSTQHNHYIADNGHYHYYAGSFYDYDISVVAAPNPYYTATTLQPTTAAAPSATFGNQSVSHYHTATTGSASSSGTWIPRYVDVLICYKN
jgi:hypothetical protein